MIPEEIQKILIAAASYWIGYRFGLRRDKRREFNEVAARISAKVRASHTSPVVIPENDLDAFRNTAGIILRVRFNRALSRHRDACKEYGGSAIDPITGSQAIPPRPEKIAPHASRLLKTLRSK